MNIANYITSLRIIACPIVIILLLKQYNQAAFWTFLAAGLTDGIDGYFAKRFQNVTRIGKMLDPAADKLMLVSIFVMLGFYFNIIPVWLVILMIARDVVIVFTSFFFMRIDPNFTVTPHIVSKLNTALQIGLATLALLDLAYSLGITSFLNYFVYVVAFTTVLSWAIYFRIGLNMLKKR